MSAIAIVAGVAEGLQLLQTLSQTVSAVSAAIQTAQSTGKPVDWSSIDTAEGTAELNLLTAISNARAAGK
jgi:hypothetical protein